MIDYKKLIAENEAHPPKTDAQHTADLVRLVAEERERIAAMGTPKEAAAILAREADERDAIYRESCEDAGRKADAARAEAWRKAIADREVQLASGGTEILDRQAEAKRTYDAAMTAIQERLKTEPLDIKQGAAILELRKQQQARRDDIALHETRVKLAGGQPGRY